MAKLDAEEASLRDALAHRDEDASEIARELAAFDAAALSFKEYREKQCSFVASLAAGGNASSYRRLLCEIGLNRARLADLIVDRPLEI